MSDSEIIRSNGGVTFAGPDAVELFRAATLKSSLQLFSKTGIRPTRGVGPTQMLKLASRYSGKTYKRGQFEQAIADLDVWINTMKSALPITDRDEK